MYSGETEYYIEESMIEGEGPHLFYDAMMHRWFRSRKSKIYDACKTLNGSMKWNDGRPVPFVTMNEFYSEIDVPNVPVGEYFVWEAGGIASELAPDMDRTIATSEGSATVLDWIYRPMAYKMGRLGDML